MALTQGYKPNDIILISETQWEDFVLIDYPRKVLLLLCNLIEPSYIGTESLPVLRYIQSPQYVPNSLLHGDEVGELQYFPLKTTNVILYSIQMI